jgi:hypothetical protein
MSQTARPTVEKNKQIIPNFKEDTLNSHDVALSTADKYFGQGPETESFIECRRSFWEQFPDSHTTIDIVLGSTEPAKSRCINHVLMWLTFKYFTQSIIFFYSHVSSC